MSTLGHSLPRLDARAKVTGDAQYPGDINLPRQLWMKVLFARRPHARIKRLDTSQAERAPGVVRVFTARDMPVNEFGLIFFDAPVLVNNTVRWVGEKVACVVAETEKQAEHARDLIAVEYEDLPVISDPHDAMIEGAAQIHPHYARNVMKHIPIRKGDTARGFEQAEVVVESVYHTPAQEHAYLQPEAGVAYIDDAGRVTVAAAGQWTHEDQQQIAHALNLPVEKVRVIYPAIGGAFGGREDMSVQIILALAAWRLNRPVKIIWSREESMIAHHKRHPMWLTAKWGATRDGKLVAAEVEVIADAGPYAYTSTKVLGNAALACTGPYAIPNIKVDAYAVVTNNVVTGAFRGFGGPQGHFAAEMQMNKLAEKLGIDPVELRLKNVLHAGDLLSTQTPLPGGKVSLVEVVEKCAKEFSWTNKGTEGTNGIRNTPPVTRHPSLVTGFGFACALKNIGFSFGAPEGATATVELRGAVEIEQAIVHHAGAEVGQGAHTVMAQVAAEVLKLPVEKIELVASDTATSGNSGSASASRMTWMVAHSVRGAAEAALQKWREEERPASATYEYIAPPTDNYAPEDGRGKTNIAYGYVAQAVEVEVDRETGQVRVVRVTCADDVGRAVNPQMIRGQIEGAIAQAQGWAITENFLQKGGRVLTPYFSNYLIPGVMDVPERVDSVILEFPDENGAWGIRGMAEMPFIPLAPAIVAAVHDATGAWIDELPLTPGRVVEALKKK
ncbi:MAG: xanthine dehydrogenase family protein molybdopterin-binding subunit [Chloroflexi bacterium]|nr:xanthine dehydrogenase family protein molybdopterin-binding subunit [Chloroflexota bacterium]